MLQLVSMFQPTFSMKYNSCLLTKKTFDFSAPCSQSFGKACGRNPRLHSTYFYLSLSAQVYQRLSYFRAFFIFVTHVSSAAHT